MPKPDPKPKPRARKPRKGLRRDTDAARDWLRNRKPLPAYTERAREYQREFELRKRELLPASCTKCGKITDRHNGTLHHIRRRSQGGTNEPSNLLPVCHNCHGWIHRNVAAAKTKGWLS